MHTRESSPHCKKAKNPHQSRKRIRIETMNTNTEKKDLTSYLQSLFKQLDQGVGINASDADINLTLCLDEGGNVVAESNNTITLHFLHYFSPTYMETEQE